MRTPLIKIPGSVCRWSPGWGPHSHGWEDWFFGRNWLMPERFERLAFSSAMQWRENDENIFLEAKLPGVKQKDIQVQVDGEVLQVQAERRGKEREADTASVWSTCFSESVRLPSTVNFHEARAELKNDLLTVTIPKTQHGRTRTVPVVVSQESVWSRCTDKLLQMKEYMAGMIRHLLKSH